MKIVFSRKGVDSAAGKCASALIDGRPVSIPIPTGQPTPTTYGMLSGDLPSIASDLSNGRLGPSVACHLDPDIDRYALDSRPSEWRGALGQAAAALTHLRNQDVGPGDVFLFWGLYRPVERVTEGWRYAGPRRHAVFGWLAVGEVLAVDEDGEQVIAEYPWLSEHPHAQPGWKCANGIYLAADELVIGDKAFAGSGVFTKAYQLTSECSALPSTWSVPRWLDSDAGGVGMSYHRENSWLGNGALRAAARGQEFVADAGERHEPREWLKKLLETHA